MEIREVDGVQATNRAGAAELLGLSLQTIALRASPKQRAEGSGFPAPLSSRPGGMDWYPISGLEDFRESHRKMREGMRATVHHATLPGDPDGEVTAPQFRKLIQVGQGGWDRYVADSRPDWQRGADGYLPLPIQGPAAAEPRAERTWTKQAVEDWIRNRQGRSASPGRPPRSPEADEHNHTDEERPSRRPGRDRSGNDKPRS